MTDYLGIGGRFFFGGKQVLAGAHGFFYTIGCVSLKRAFYGAFRSRYRAKTK
jgi:hypothetical protein